TTDDDYLAAGGFDALRERRRRILIGIVAVACLGGALLLLLNPFGGGQPTAAASGPTLGEVAQQDTALWGIQSLAVGPVGGRLSGAALGYPTLICLSEPQQQAAKPGETVVLSGTMSVRTYMLHGSSSAMPRDLIVADCTQSPPRLLASAELKSAQTARPLDARTIAAVATTPTRQTSHPTGCESTSPSAMPTRPRERSSWRTAAAGHQPAARPRETPPC